MKKSIFSALFSAFVLVALQASATSLLIPIHGPVTIAWTINQQIASRTNEYPGLGKTNITGKGTSEATNILQIYKSSFATTPFNNSSLLSLLENSFKTTFPAGTQLVTDGGMLYVVDHTGTNVIVDISSVLTVTDTNEVDSGLDTTIQTYNKSGLNETGKGTSSGNQVIIVKYDDSALTTADGTTTTFKFIGVSAFTETGSSAASISTTDVIKVQQKGSFTIKGVGYGTIRDKDSVIQGTIIGTPSGTYTTSIP